MYLDRLGYYVKYLLPRIEGRIRVLENDLGVLPETL